MDLLSHANIRKRRSLRLNSKYPESPKKGCLIPTPIGDFDKLPLEINHAILSYLSILDLSNFCLVSKAILEFIEEYRMTNQGQRHFLATLNVHNLERTENWPADTIHAFFHLGLYMKRSSFLKSTSKRLKHISSYLHESLMCKEESCGDGRRCLSFYCYGTFIHTVIAGWDDMECLKVLEFIHQNTSMSKNVAKVFQATPGVQPHLEVFIRCFYRRAFIDVLRKKEDKAFWLSQILKPYPMIHQARLLQILFLSKTSVGVNFHSIVRDRLDVAALSDIGNALTLLSQQALWNDDNIISVIDEIIEIPSTWHPQNVAALLMNCGDAITLKVLVSKAINNRFSEIIVIAHHLLLVCVKAFQTIKRASQCIWKFIEQLKTNEKIYVATELVNSFKDAVYDIVDIGGEPMSELDAVLEAMTQFTQDLLNLAIESLKENKLPLQHFTKVTSIEATREHPDASVVEE